MGESLTKEGGRKGRRRMMSRGGGGALLGVWEGRTVTVCDQTPEHVPSLIAATNGAAEASPKRGGGGSEENLSVLHSTSCSLF